MVTPTPALASLSPEGPGIWQILLMVFYLAVVLVGVYYATRLFARIAQRGTVRPGKKAGAGRRIFLIDRFALDREKSIVLMEEGDKRYLLGVTPNKITLLREMDVPDCPPSEEQETQLTPAHRTITFQELFKAWKERGKG